MCRREAYRIFSGFETGVLLVADQLSLVSQPGTGSGCLGILVKVCRREAVRILSRLVRGQSKMIFADPDANVIIPRSRSSWFPEGNLPGSYYYIDRLTHQDLDQIRAGNSKQNERKWTHRVSISRPSVYKPISLPRWTESCLQQSSKVSCSFISRWSLNKLWKIIRAPNFFISWGNTFFQGGFAFVLIIHSLC